MTELRLLYIYLILIFFTRLFVHPTTLYGKSENSAVKIFRKISAEETRSRYILSPQLEYQTMNPFDCVMKLDRLIRGEEDLDHPTTPAMINCVSKLSSTRFSNT